MPRQMTPEEYRSHAHKLYEMGVGRLFFWDTNQRTYRYPQWTDIRGWVIAKSCARGHGQGAENLSARQGSVKLGDWVVGYADAG